MVEVSETVHSIFDYVDSFDDVGEAWECITNNDYIVFQDLSEEELTDVLFHMLSLALGKGSSESILKSMIQSIYKDNFMELLFYSYNGIHRRSFNRMFLFDESFEIINRFVINHYGFDFDDCMITCFLKSVDPIKDFELSRLYFNKVVKKSSDDYSFEGLLAKVKILYEFDISDWDTRVVLLVMNYMIQHSHGIINNKLWFDTMFFMKNKIVDVPTGVDVFELFNAWFKNVEFDSACDFQLFDDYVNEVVDSLDYCYPYSFCLSLANIPTICSYS